MANKCIISVHIGSESDCDLLWLTSKKGAKLIVSELTTDEVYNLLSKAGLGVFE